MEIIQQIGINQTAFIQFIIFSIAMLFLINFVFKPYAQAAEQRENQTKGGEELAVELQKQAVDVAKSYEQKLREQSDKLKTIFESHKKMGSSDADLLISKARAEADGYVEANRKIIEQNILAVSQDLKAQSPAVALAITQKLIGK
jgi:F0F1-type ATP synthase membrane subunit b/b'